ncbi:MAG TPA: cyclopropane-fatty-acyl-phospholipid synthase family protein [Solirubrobacteraceae bacterium]|nr:cyclopropane-fatty-acyl-phospholipid synthase family protein [Solirubrobacteraceae bacterium]
MNRSDVATAVRGALGGIAGGRLQALPFTLRFWDGSTLAGESATPVTVIRSPKAFAYLLRAPNQIGLARAWVTGALDVEGDLGVVLAARKRFEGIALSAADRTKLVLAALRSAPSVLVGPAPVPGIEAAPRGRRHSLGRDRIAVRHHYDVSNDFYRLLLGPSLTYSCGYFETPQATLDSAQERKHELICRKLRLVPGERLLDIGCGWGSLLLHAAARHGVRGVGVTLSASQAELARERVREQGLSDVVEIRIADYREISDGPFDKVASVGMYEHVGRAELGRYAGTIAGLLRPGGLFLNHGIARLASEPPRSDTFISRYIFPDGELHPVAEIQAAMLAAGLEVRDVESLREHYPLTLRRWLANLESHLPEVIAMVGEERERAWWLYLVASAQGFDDGDISIYQVLGARLGSDHQLPLDRAELIGAAKVKAMRQSANEREEQRAN